MARYSLLVLSFEDSVALEQDDIASTLERCITRISTRLENCRKTCCRELRTRIGDRHAGGGKSWAGGRVRVCLNLLSATDGQAPNIECYVQYRLR